MNFYRCLFVCMILIFITGAIQASKITGQITDKSDGTAIYLASVSVRPSGSGKTLGAPTDENGNFEIKGVPAGKYSVSISSIGYSKHIIPELIIGDKETKTISVSLASTFINLDAVSVTASRRVEKILEAPAAVYVLESENIESRTTLTPTEHLKGMPAVDVASTGLNQSNVVVRGFNNIFSGALLVLTDNRIARVPSLRYNAYNFIPTINEDIERIEIVSGPGSALYGPNSASGVMHIITKSPFASQGTTVSLGGGERELFLGSFRHAGVAGDRIGYKFSAQYYQGLDWKHYEKAELERPLITKYRPTTTGPEYVGDAFPNNRDFNIDKMAGEGRVDFLIGSNSSLILNGGFSQSSSIELTGLGAGQAIDWSYSYGQARYRYKDLFIQTFVNASDAGDTYLLQTGQLIVDKSKVWASQIQHRYAPNTKLSFTYGFDALFTRPNTESTINGLNEQKDNIDEFGGYVQSEYKLTNKFKLIGAMRLDDHNQLEDMVFSPRAALTYQPTNEHNFRLTFNRAFSTPDNNNLFLDILSLNDMKGLGEKFEHPVSGYRPETDVRVQGVPQSGFHWRINDNGPQFRSTYAPFAGMSTSDYIEFNDPAFSALMWNLGSQGAVSLFSETLLNNGVPGASVQAIATSMLAIAPATLSNLNHTLKTLNQDTESLDPSTVNDIADIGRLKPTITQTLELGYNGMIGDRLKFSVDLYRTEKNDFIGPLSIETPTVHLHPDTLYARLYPALLAAINDPTNAADVAVLNALDALAMGGNNDGNVTEELTAIFTAGATAIPFGTVTPDEAYDPTAILVTYRNFGDINFYGADFSFAYHANQNWDFGGNYSYVSENFFKKSATQVHDIHLNSPKHKAAGYIQYQNPKYGLSTNLRYRFVDAFVMTSPFFGSEVKAYHLFDLNAGLDFFHNTHLAITVQNVFDNRHIEFVGAPELGRLSIVRLTQSF